jgi:tetratricopeptide (TPR) repeat protein
MMYYTHNFQFLAAAAAMLGQCAQAVDAAAKAVSQAAPMAGHDPMAEYALPWSLYTAARCENWDVILAYPRPAAATPVTLAFWHYARALEALAKRDLDRARNEREQFEIVRKGVALDMMLNTNRAHDLLSIAASVLDARLASAAGNVANALTLWKKAIAAQDALIYDEPPAWYYPVRESLGGEHLRAKQYADAERVFRQDLELNPNNPRSLFGLSQALRAQSRKDEAEAVQRRFERQWQGADVQIRLDTL